MRQAIGLLTALIGRKEREHAWRAVAGYKNLAPATCPCCGFEGKFDSFGVHVPRSGASCPACQSKERHRLLALSMRDGFVNFADEDVLHFAPETIVSAMVRRQGPRAYTTGDIKPGRGDLVLDIEDIDLPDCSFTRIICSHVLEHVDDTRALAELRRVLRPDGYAVVLVPVVEGWRETFEDPAITDPKEREHFFGQHDHIRYYGADLRDRILQAGFELEEFTAGPTDSPKFGLIRGQKIFRARRGANA
jgi:SAM-dependent methyltransferase